MFEWDPDKSEATRRRRGFGFEVIEQFDWDYAACLEEQEINSETREKLVFCIRLAFVIGESCCNIQPPEAISFCHGW